MDGTEMLIGCVVYMINLCTLFVIAWLAINKYLIAAECTHLPVCAVSAQQCSWYPSPCSSIFPSFLSHSLPFIP